MLRRHSSFVVLLCLLAPAAVGAAIEGVVVTPTGIPVEHVQLDVDPDGITIFTGQGGQFRLPETAPPVVLRFVHPRFQVLEMEVSRDTPMPLRVALTFKQEIYDEIAVSASPGEENFAPVSVDVSVLEPAETAAPPSSLTDLVAEAPAVSQNGQGGLFQTYSIRGVSRQRVMTLVSGMRIVGERRAGVSASFLDPRLMQSVDVLRGPSSTFYGSGALGGVIQVFPRRFEDWAVEAGYGSQGDENYQLVGWGDEKWSLGFARRDAGTSEAPNGDVLPAGFTQISGSVDRRWRAGGSDYQLLAIASDGTDIGKPNTDFPERTTVYPDERHLLLRFAMRTDSEWLFEAWAHPNSLDTRVTEEGALDEVENEAVDLGFNVQKQIRIAGSVDSRFGLDYFGRRDVTALERSTDLESGATTEQRTLDGAEDNELGLYGSMEWHVGPAVVLGGIRFTHQIQDNAGVTSTSDSALTGFAGLVVPLGAGFELASNLGTGLRFPSLSERYFTGTTGRGEVIGNPDLEPERSLNFDVGLRWYGDRLFVSGFVSRNEISDYIERVEVEPDLLTFVNLVSGTITGFEYSGFYQISPAWSLNFGGHIFAGEDELGEPLFDIPADRFALGGAWRRGAWTAEVRWEQRSSIGDPGPGEKAIPSAGLVSAMLDYSFKKGFSLTLNGRNLLDEEYFNSADRRVALSPGRSLGLALRWHPQ